jgi:hypothetical protein
MNFYHRVNLHFQTPAILDEKRIEGQLPCYSIVSPAAGGTAASLIKKRKFCNVGSASAWRGVVTLQA